MSTNEELEQCIHQWHIDPPAGPISLGTCSKCGEQKEFVNSLTQQVRAYSTIPLSNDAIKVQQWLDRQHKSPED